VIATFVATFWRSELDILIKIVMFHCDLYSPNGLWVTVAICVKCFTIPVDPSGRSLAGIAGSEPAGRDRCLSFEFCVLSGRGLCVGLIARPEKSYQVWCV
jgi:hypothetical protein